MPDFEQVLNCGHVFFRGGHRNGFSECPSGLWYRVRICLFWKTLAQVH